MRRLTAQQVADLRLAVESNAETLRERLAKAKARKPVDPKEIDFYASRLRRDEASLGLLPKRGGAEVEDDISDEQRDEDETEAE